MAVTITRSIWIDDDGTGTTGTVINQALHTTLYNEIDTALAKLAQLTGGNTFTGNQAIGGVLTVSTIGNHGFNANGVGFNALYVSNTQAGGGNGAVVYVGNDTTQSLGSLASYASTFGSSGVAFANGTTLANNGAGGLTLATSAAAPVRFYSNNLLRGLFASAGEFWINSTQNLGPGQLMLTCDPSHIGISLLNSSPTNAQNFIFFYNSALSGAGGITQTGANTVAYNTASDARLKDDDGAATDLAALRGVIVHDFRWKADGARARGVFAQEAAAVFPRAVAEGTDATTDDGSLVRPWMTDYSKFVPDLIVGWQQHDAALAELRAILAAVKG